MDKQPEEELPPGVTPLEDDSADDAELLPFDVSGVPPKHKEAPDPGGPVI
jgi:hypothetical protein